MARKIFIFGIANHSRSLSRSGKNNWYKNFFLKNEDNYSVLLAGAVDVSLIMVVTLFFFVEVGCGNRCDEAKQLFTRNI